jgi:hypothetical protein
MLVASLLPHGGNRVIAFIDFVKSLRWPAVAALLELQLDLIRRPIKSLRGNGAGVVRLGDIACRITPHALRQPNEDIVRAVAAMDGDILRTVLDSSIWTRTRSTAVARMSDTAPACAGPPISSWWRRGPIARGLSIAATTR